MSIYHTSPVEIEGPKQGLFGDFICFSGDVYVMTAGSYVTYELDSDADEILEASQMWYQENTSA